jgi:hypothetical protein
MTDNRLGDRVDIDQILEGDLPYPGQQQAPSAFSGAEGMDAPFKVSTGQSSSTNKAGLDVGNYDPKSTAAQQTTKAAEKPIDKEPPVASKPTTANVSMQLRKFREAFGVKRISTKTYVVKRQSEEGEVNFSFQLRQLNYEDYQWAVMKATEHSIENDVPLMFAFHFATVAIAISAMDVDLAEGTKPTPIYEVFNIPVENTAHIRDPFYPATPIRTAAAALLFTELHDSLFDIVQELHDAVDEYVTNRSQAVQKEKEEVGPLA